MFEKAPAFKVFEDNGYRKDDDVINENCWSTEKGINYGQCLTGSIPNGSVQTALGDDVEQSLCIWWLHQFTEGQDVFEHWPAAPVDDSCRQRPSLAIIFYAKTPKRAERTE